MSDAAIAPYRVQAYNMSWDSENKIHDDTVAQKFGFAGGLVPGVDVYGYMTHQAVARWGRAWLEHGTADCRFAKPVYDGRQVTVTAQDGGDGIAIEVESEGVRCATGTATLAAAVSPPDLLAYPSTAVRPSRPPASPETLVEGTWLGINPFPVTPDYAEKYLRELKETETLYAREKLVHPGIILRCCNWVLSHNVVLGPWMHVGSTVQNFAPAHVGDTLTARGRILRNYDHKGHLFVDADVLVMSNDKNPIARVKHVAIYRPRQLAEG